MSGAAMKSLDRALGLLVRRMTWTGRARVALCLALIVLPLAILHAIGRALLDGIGEFAYSIKVSANEGWQFWYRDVYRVARYGSVHDE